MLDSHSQELVEKGIAALKAGERAEARSLLAEAVQQNPGNERGWLYLAALLPRPQAQAALERVLALNPANRQAQRGLESLRQAPTPPLETATETQPIEAPAPPAADLSKTNGSAKAVARPAPPKNPPSVEELPVNSNETPSRYTPPGGLAANMRNQVVEATVKPARPEPIIFERGYHPLESSEAASPVPANLSTEEAPPELESAQLRNLLTAPYLARQRRKRVSPFLAFLLFVVPVGVIAVAVYFLVLQPASGQAPVGVAAPTLAPTPARPSPPASGLSNLNDTPPPAPTIEATPPGPTATPAPTIPAALKISVAQNERAVLRGYTLSFSTYENRSNNFSFGGAGTPKGGYHFEGLLVNVENTSPQVLPVGVEVFQGVDGRNNFLKPLSGGRAPSLDVTRLQAGESRLAWLTFEVEDGTTLRRVSFNPTAQPDLNNSADVNLTLPAVTPAPTLKPTARPTSTPKPTATATPVPPTATPAPTFTPVIVGGVPADEQPGEGSATATIQPTTGPTLAPTTEPATEPATALPTATPADTTPQPTTLPLAEMNKRLLVSSFAITATSYVVTPTIKPPPLILPSGYHYEAVKIGLENTGANDVADYLTTYPFYLRDSEDRLYSVGPHTFDAADKFNPKVFAPTATAPGKTRAAGTLYFLVRDGSKGPRTLIFYATPELDSPRIEIALK